MDEFIGKRVLLLGLLSCPCGCDDTVLFRGYNRAAHYFMGLGCEVYNPMRTYSDGSIKWFFRLLMVCYQFIRCDYMIILSSLSRSSMVYKAFTWLGKKFKKEIYYQEPEVCE